MVAGDHDRMKIDGTEEYRAIDEIYIHPEWKFDKIPINDIALIKLKGMLCEYLVEEVLNHYNFAVCVSGLNPICLPGSNFDSFGAGDRCKVAGWGSMDPETNAAPRALRVYL